MTADAKKPESFSLKRWSRVKLEAARAPHAPVAADAAHAAAVAPATATVVPANAATQGLSTNVTGSPPALGRESVPEAAVNTKSPTATPGAALPPIDSLTIDSDFTAFLQPKVEESVKRQALKKLFGDPRFNVMDGLDVYIDDYSKPDPLAPEVARQLAQARYILDPPRTRINDQGFLEDVPPEEVVAQPPAEASEALSEARPLAPPADGVVAAAPVPEALPEPEAPAANVPADAGPSEPASR